MVSLGIPAVSPLSILAVGVNVTATGWVAFSTLKPERRRDHLLSGLAGVVCSYEAVRLVQEFGWWGADAAGTLDRVADLSVLLVSLLLLALCVATRLRRQRDEQRPAGETHVFGSAAEAGQAGRPIAQAQWPDDPSRDRRRQLRVQIQKAVAIETLDDLRRELKGHTVDFSGGGLGVILSQPIALNTAVLVRLEEGLLLAEVTNCREVRGEYRLGLCVTQFLSQSATPAEAGAVWGRQPDEELRRNSWIIP